MVEQLVHGIFSFINNEIDVKSPESIELAMKMESRKYVNLLIDELSEFVIKLEITKQRTVPQKNYFYDYSGIQNAGLTYESVRFKLSHSEDTRTRRDSFYSVLSRLDKLNRDTVGSLASSYSSHKSPTIAFTPLEDKKEFLDTLSEAIDPEYNTERSFGKRLLARKLAPTIYDPVFMKAYDDKCYFKRDNWLHERSFVLFCSAYCVGIVNLWQFPYKVANFHGLSFILAYLVMSFIFGLPFVILEMGLGQFSGLGITSFFKVKPIFWGLGWSMMAIICVYLIHTGVIMSYTYFYFFVSALPKLPWNRCDHNFNTNSCLTFHELGNLKLNSTINLAATEYWEMNVIGFRYLNNKYFQISDSIDFPKWHLVLGLLINWVFVCIPVIYGVKSIWRVLRYTLIIPFILGILITILGFSLPGAFNGLKYMFRLDLNYERFPYIIAEAVSQNIFSLGLGMGGYITFSSLNSFRDNFFRDAMAITLVDLFFSLFSSISIFSYLGHISFLTNKPISVEETTETFILFIAYPTVLSNVKYPNMWMLMFTITILLLGSNTQMMCMEILTIEFRDNISEYMEIDTVRSAIIVCLSSIFFFIGIFLVTPIGIVWDDILTVRIFSFGTILIVIFEGVILVWLYGINNIRRDFYLMAQFDLGLGFFGVIPILPVLIIVSLIFLYIDSHKTEIFRFILPRWVEMLGFSLVFFVLLPLQILIYYELITLRLKNRDLSFTKYISIVTQPHLLWGPRLKIYGLFDEYYREKFLREIVECINLIIKEYESNEEFNELENWKFYKPMSKLIVQYILENAIMDNIHSNVKASVIVRSRIQSVNFEKYFKY